MTESYEAERWLGEHVRAYYADDLKHTRIEGRVVAYTDRPQVLIETEEGEKDWWHADLCEVVEVWGRQSREQAVGQVAGAQLVEVMEALLYRQPSSVPSSVGGMPVLVGIDREDAADFVCLINELMAIKSTVGQGDDYQILRRVVGSAIAATRFNRIRVPGYEWLKGSG